MNKVEKSHDVTGLLVALTVICGLLRAGGSGCYKAMNECSPAFSAIYLNLLCCGLGYFFAGLALSKFHKETFLPTKRDFLIAGLNCCMGSIVQALIAMAFISGAGVGGPEYVGQWITIFVVVICTYLTQGRLPTFRQVSLIFAVAVGASFYITGDQIVSTTKTVPIWMIWSLVCSVLSGLCISTYNWWLEGTKLGTGPAMMLTGGLCTFISLFIFSICSFIDLNWTIPNNSEYWFNSLGTVIFWVIAGVCATEVSRQRLLSSIRQSVTMGAQLIGAVIIGMIFFSDFPTIQQWPGIVITVGSIFLMVYVHGSRYKTTKV